MKAVFADTFYFLALLNPRDAAHARALDFSEKNDVALLTTHWILTEVADALSQPSGRSKVVALLRNLESDPAFTVLPSNPALFRNGFDLYASRPDKDWSLTDCISFAVMHQLKLVDALTGDHHFEQAGFRCLLAQ